MDLATPYLRTITKTTDIEKAKVSHVSLSVYLARGQKRAAKIIAKKMKKELALVEAVTTGREVMDHRSSLSEKQRMGYCERLSPDHGKKRIGYIYILKIWKCYKIGLSTKPEKRILHELNKLTAFDIKIIYLMPVDGALRRIEADIHRLVKNKRIYSEIFTLDKDDFTKIDNYLRDLQ